MSTLFTNIKAFDLEKNSWYVGRGRNGNVGLWDGDHFLVIGSKFGHHLIKYESLYINESGTFQPFMKIDEGIMLESFGKIGWDAHYGRLMAFQCDNKTKVL
jgi:hypothetical protein